jgi:Aerotolerance regulator N-terminal
MTFLAPGFLFASLAVAAAMVALHFIVIRQPRAAILPTARFVPDTRATTVARDRRPSDLLLMLLRALTVLAAGAGLARPALTPSRSAQARVILVDVSRSARDSIAIRDSVRAVWRNQDALVLFDSSARLISGSPNDTIGALHPTGKRGNVSAALIAALRAGSSLSDRADSLELVVVSPFAREELDAATDTIRRLWPGKATLVRIGGSFADSAAVAGKLDIKADANDPLAVTIGIARSASTAKALIYRGGDPHSRAINSSSTSADITTPRSASTPNAGGALIEWPVASRPSGAVPRPVRDTVGGVMAGDAAVVATFERAWTFPPDSLRGADVIARWVDGEPAAIERPDGAGCIRSVAIPVTPVGDLVIRHDWTRFVASLSGPCASVTSLIPADRGDVAKLEGKGGLAPREAFQRLTDAHSSLAPWLFALALVAAIGELFGRRRARNTASLGENRSASTEARAA